MTIPVNSMDNSESVSVHEKKDVFIASNTGTAGELTDAITYMKYLKEKADVQASDKTIQVGAQKVLIKDLLPPTTEFDEERLRVMQLLVKLTPDDPIYQGLAKDFGTNSLFELASEIANYSIARTRGEKIYALLHGRSTDKDNKNKSIYDQLIGQDADRAHAKKSLNDASFTMGYKQKFRNI